MSHLATESSQLHWLSFYLTNDCVSLMTPYHEYFLPIFLLGCLIAAVTSFLAGRLSGCLWPALLLIVGVLAFWAAIFVGSELGYRAWQSMPDPPEEAFSDASAMGALLFGWFPGGLFCLTVFGVVRSTSWLLRILNPRSDNSALQSKPQRQAVETGNPYQGPNNP